VHQVLGGSGGTNLNEFLNVQHNAHSTFPRLSKRQQLRSSPLSMKHYR